MSEHSLISHLAKVRDAGASTYDSWNLRYGNEGGAETHNFEMSAIHMLGIDTPDDIIWGVMAAAMCPHVTHLKMNVQWDISREYLEQVFREIRKRIVSFGFRPYDFEFCFVDKARTGGYFWVSLFQKDEF